MIGLENQINTRLDPKNTSPEPSANLSLLRGHVLVGLPVLMFGMVCVFGCAKKEPLRITENNQSPSGKSATAQTNAVSLDWPCLYGPEHNSISRATELQLDFDDKGPPRVWSQPVGKGYSAPVAAEGKVIMLSRIDNEEVVQCLNQETGDSVWEFRYPTNFVCKEDGYSSGPYSTPSISDGRVVTVGASGQFHCINLETGELVWDRDLVGEYGVKQKEWSISSSPLIHNKKIYFNLGAKEKQAGIVCLNLNTGETIWESTKADYCHATPIVAEMHGQERLFAMVAEGLSCLNPDDGTVYWEIEHQQRSEDAYHQNAVTPVVFENRICMTCGPRISPGFRCIEVQPDGSYLEPWSNIRLLNSQYTNLVVVGGFLFGFTSVKAGGPEFVCIDLKKGEDAWRSKPDLGRGNILAVGDRLLILGENGVLAAYELNADQAREIWRTNEPILKKTCFTSMALSNGLLLARNEVELVCLNLRNSKANE